ncbi:MAG: hypothetical protein NC412_01850 [Roseburia sp.]|nr:hypothetical protein [Roseburia sp.]MCM1278001.1 hypothetical protein [Robinsoniella sp.]
MKNIRFCVAALREDVLGFIFKIVQMTISFIIIGFIISGINENYTLNRQIKNIMGNKEIYVLKDNNADSYYEEIMWDESYVPKFRKLTDAALAIQDRILVMNNVNIVGMEYKRLNVLEVSGSFFEKYEIKGDFDESSIKNDFILHKCEGGMDSIVKPAILSNGFKGKYKKGDEIADDAGNQYVVYGFLDDKQYYAAPIQGKEMNPLEDVILTPVYIDVNDVDSMYWFLYGCQFLVDDISELDELMGINNKERILDTYLVSYTKQLENIGNEYLNSFVLEGILGICLFVFAFAGMVCTMLQRIADNAYEYAVNILCGAKLTDIYARIIMEFVMIIMTGVLVAICIFRISLATLGIVSLAFFCFLIMCLFAKYKIDFESLVENLRSRG